MADAALSQQRIQCYNGQLFHKFEVGGETKSRKNHASWHYKKAQEGSA